MAVRDAADLRQEAPAWPVGGLLRRVRVRLTASVLDARLAAGEFPWSDTDLACRSSQLVSVRARRGIAQGLERLWTDPPRRPGLSAAIPHDLRAVRLARPALEQLVGVLRSREWVHPRGVALTRLFLTDPCSALYLPAYPEELYEIARAALFALGPRAVPRRSEEGHRVRPPHASASRGHRSAIADESAAGCPVSRSRRTWSRLDRAGRSRGDF
jgi:hypothetical protein